MTVSKPRWRAPPYLSHDAAAIWRQVIAHLRRNGTLALAYSGLIEGYAMAVARQRQLSAELVKADPDARTGLLRAVEAAAASVRNYATTLGLSPRKAKPAAKAALGDKPAGGKGRNVWRGVLDR
jgi:phage terminase small subunit